MSTTVIRSTPAANTTTSMEPSAARARRTTSASGSARSSPACCASSARRRTAGYRAWATCSPARRAPPTCASTTPRRMPVATRARSVGCSTWAVASSRAQPGLSRVRRRTGWSSCCRWCSRTASRRSSSRATTPTRCRSSWPRSRPSCESGSPRNATRPEPRQEGASARRAHWRSARPPSTTTPCPPRSPPRPSSPVTPRMGAFVTRTRTPARPDSCCAPATPTRSPMHSPSRGRSRCRSPSVREATASAVGPPTTGASSSTFDG